MIFKIYGKLRRENSPKFKTTRKLFLENILILIITNILIYSLSLPLQYYLINLLIIITPLIHFRLNEKYYTEDSEKNLLTLNTLEKFLIFLIQIIIIFIIILISNYLIKDKNLLKNIVISNSLFITYWFSIWWKGRRYYNKRQYYTNKYLPTNNLWQAASYQLEKAHAFKNMKRPFKSYLNFSIAESRYKNIEEKHKKESTYHKASKKYQKACNLYKNASKLILKDIIHETKQNKQKIKQKTEQAENLLKEIDEKILGKRNCINCGKKDKIENMYRYVENNTEKGFYCEKCYNNTENTDNNAEDTNNTNNTKNTKNTDNNAEDTNNTRKANSSMNNKNDSKNSNEKIDIDIEKYEIDSLTLDDAYQILGISEPITKKEVESSYKMLSRNVHPDTPDGSTKKAKFLNKAKEKVFDEKF